MSEKPDPEINPNPSQIQVVSISPSGTRTDGPVLTISKDAPPVRSFNEDSWDEEQTVGELCSALERRDSSALEATMRAMDRLNCWRKALGQLLVRPANGCLGNALLDFWLTYGFRIGPALKCDLVLLIDVLRHLLPPYVGPDIKLYRGELNSRHLEHLYGIAWTPKLGIASTFASRREHDEGRGVVLEIDGTSDVIVAKGSCHQRLWLLETEYVVDPRLIREVRVIDRSLWPEGFCYR